MAVIFALIAMVGWGVGDIFVAQAARKIGTIRAAFWWYSGILIFSSIYIPFAGPVSDWNYFGLGMALNFIGFFSVLLYFKALEIGNASLVGTIAGAFPALTVLLSVVFFKEQLTIIQAAAVGMTLTGLTLTSLRLNEIKSRNFNRLISDKSVIYSIIIFLIWGFFWAFIRIPVEKIGWFWANYSGNFFFILLPIFKLIKKIPFKDLKDKNLLIILVPMCILTMSANFAFNLGITYGYSSLVAPIAGAYPALFVIISRFVFKEKLTHQQKLGIVITLLGVVIIGITSV